MSKIVSLFESKAFDTALLGALAAAGAVFGFNVPVGTIMLILTPVMVAIGAQGWSDAVKVKANMALQHAVKMHALEHGMVTHQELLEGKTISPVRPSTAQAGFTKMGLMMAVATIGSMLAVTGALVVSSEGCGANKPPVVTDVVDCVKAEGAVIAKGYTIEQIVVAVYDAIASIQSGGAAAALATLASIATTWGPDVVACIIDNYPSGGGGSGSGSGSATGSGSAAPPPVSVSTRFKLEPSVKAQLLQQFAPGKKINHGKGN